MSLVQCSLMIVAIINLPSVMNRLCHKLAVLAVENMTQEEIEKLLN